MKKIEKVIHLEKPGTLKKFISETEKMSVTHLKISGFLNSKDFDVLDEMCSSQVKIDKDDNHFIKFNKPPFLIHLDLGDCCLTGKPYLNEFTYHSKLEKFVCPKNLERIKGMDFFASSMLKSVVVPETFKEFGYVTFTDCQHLEEINFPDELRKIGSFAFCGCTSLKTVKIPANVSVIGSAAFGGCHSLEKFEIEETNPHFSVSDGVLFNKDKTKLVAFPGGFKNKHYSVPESVEIIGDGAFLNLSLSPLHYLHH